MKRSQRRKRTLFIRNVLLAITTFIACALFIVQARNTSRAINGLPQPGSTSAIIDTERQGFYSSPALLALNRNARQDARLRRTADIDRDEADLENSFEAERAETQPEYASQVTQLPAEFGSHFSAHPATVDLPADTSGPHTGWLGPRQPARQQ